MQRNTGRSFADLDEGGEEDDTGEWIMSYADTVTLLLCFFILFFAEQDRKNDHDVLTEIMQALKKPTDDSAEGGRQEAQMLSNLEVELRDKLNEFEVKKVNMGIERRRREILLRLYEEDFFHIGSWNLKTKGKQVLAGVAKMLKPFEDAILVKVEGHSDSLPVNPFSAYRTNLNLSSLRASQAANVLITSSISESRIRVVGYGAANLLVQDRSPASDEYIPEKGKKNRRIEVRIQVDDESADEAIDLVF